MTPQEEREPLHKLQALIRREEDLGPLSFYYILRYLVRLATGWFFRGKCHDAGRIPVRGPVILASTHQSILEPLLLPTLTSRPQCFMGKDSLFRIPVLGWLIGKLGAVPVRRGTARARKGLHLCQEILRHDRVLLFFPEGTRSRDGKLQPLKSGVAFLAKRSGAPVVPVLGVGTFEAWPRHRKLPRMEQVSFHFGRAITYQDRESFDSFTERLSSAFRDLARQAGAEHMLGEESGRGEDAESTPTNRNNFHGDGKGAPQLTCASALRKPMRFSVEARIDAQVILRGVKATPVPSV